MGDLSKTTPTVPELFKLVRSSAGGTQNNLSQTYNSRGTDAGPCSSGCERSRSMQVVLSGRQGWEHMLRTHYGEFRWKTLKEALKADTDSLCYHPDPRVAAATSAFSHCDADEFQQAIINAGLRPSGIPQCYCLPASVPSKVASALITQKLPLAYFIGKYRCLSAVNKNVT